jgi:hypothetical protein
MPPKAATACFHHRGSLGPILLQKSKVAGRLIFREITKREAIADSYGRTHISEVACEFSVGQAGHWNCAGIGISLVVNVPDPVTPIGSPEKLTAEKLQS